MMNRVPQSLEPGLAARVFFNPSNMLTLHLKVQPMAHAKDAYTPDDLLTLEKYFDTRVAIPPYRVSLLINVHLERWPEISTLFMMIYHAPLLLHLW